jgi:hypothetical protein
MKPDLLGLIRGIRGEEQTGVKHEALERIRTFIHHRLYKDNRRKSKEGLQPRLFYGQQDLPSYLAEKLRLPYDTFNLEVVSPYFDNAFQARTLQKLVEELAPKETRVFLPQAEDGAALCQKKFFQSVESAVGAQWAELPRSVVQRSRSGAEDQTDRFVHAKIYRIWSRTEDQEYLLIGSANLTLAAHSQSKAGNLEASVLFEQRNGSGLRFWLETRDEPDPETFRFENPEEESADGDVPPLTIRHLWNARRTEYFWEQDQSSTPERFSLSIRSQMMSIAPIQRGRWVALPPEVSNEVAKLLESTSFVEVTVGKRPPCTILIREEGMAHKPSILFSLSAEEILRYWSLLSPEQKEAFLAKKLPALLIAEGLPVPKVPPLERTDSMFDRFAGIFHAFSRLEKHVVTALVDERYKEAVYRLFGEKYDSLPSLIRKVTDDKEGDNVNRYVTLLAARQLLERLRREYPEFFRNHRKSAAKLADQLEGIEEVKSKLTFDTPDERERFLSWFERFFLKDIRPAQQT